MQGYTVDYHQLQRLVQAAGLQQSGAEMHGRMLGVMCVERDRVEGIRRRLFFDEPQPVPPGHALADVAEQLYRETWLALDGVGLGFSMLLPGEGEFRERCRGLIDWAKGFLRGLAISGVNGGTDLPMNGQHALADIARVARSDGRVEAEDEEAFEEACEFVWVAVVLVRELLALEDH